MNVNPFSYLIEKLKGKVDKSGDTMSGNLTVQENDERYVKCANTGKSTAVFLQSANDGSHGVFSNGYYDGSFHSEDKWLLVRAGNNKVYVNGTEIPYGSTLALKSDLKHDDYTLTFDGNGVTYLNNSKYLFFVSEDDCLIAKAGSLYLRAINTASNPVGPKVGSVTFSAYYFS